MAAMTKLDEIALNIELVLISIIEGVALTKLAENAVPLLRSTDSLQYLPYILAGLAFLLVFWAQAILHAVSFIRWPLRMEHMLLYFVAGFLQVVAYSNISNITVWFFWWTVFSLLTLFIYYVDLKIIRDTAASFAAKSGGTEFIREVERRHINEMKYLVPSALVFNIVAFSLTYFAPSLFVNPLPYSILGILQLLISLGALIDCVRNFRGRSGLLFSLFSS
jgi:hypothetical protein